MISSLKSFDGINIVYQVKRNNPFWLVLLHGVGSSSKVWEREIKILDSLGFSLIVPDLRGHGQSDKPDNKDAYAMDNFIKDLELILKKEKVMEIVPIGYSFGGVLSILYYNSFEGNVKSMILVNTDYKLSLRLYWRFKLSYLLKRMDKSVTYCLEHIRDYSKRIKKEKASLLSNIKVPVLFIEGTDDRIIPLKDMETMCQFIKNVELKRIEGAHHDIWGEKAEEVNRFIIDFLERQFGFKEPSFIESKAVSVTAILLLGLVIAGLSSPEFLKLLFGGGITGAVIGYRESLTINWLLFITKVVLGVVIAGLFFYSLKEK